MGEIKAVCISPAKGTAKQPVPTALFRADWGIEGDAHAGPWHRQVSLLSYEQLEAFRARGADVTAGAFGENLLVAGIDFKRLPLGTLFFCGSVVLELTQIGKECHSHCQIFKAVGDCIMPREGVFAKVLHGGTVSPGDDLTYALPFRTAVLTISDSAADGKRSDESGPALELLLGDWFYPVVYRAILPDEASVISEELSRLCDGNLADLILTTGGTGLSPRDVTPEATALVLEKRVPGISEAMRSASMAITPRGMLSRGVSGVRAETLIVNLPGSPRASCQCLSSILPALDHGLAALKGTVSNCAAPL